MSESIRNSTVQLQWSGRNLVRRSLLLAAGGLALLTATTSWSHGYMLYPRSRAIDLMPGDEKGWPVAGIKARFRREPCVALRPNKEKTVLPTGPLEIRLLFPDGANHVGSCTAYLFDPLRPEDRLLIGQADDCARSMNPSAGRKGQDIAGRMSVTLPERVPCDPNHCVLQWIWTAKHKSRIDPERFEHYDNCSDITIEGARESSPRDSAAALQTSALQTSMVPGSAIMQRDVVTGLGLVNRMLSLASGSAGSGSGSGSGSGFHDEPQIMQLKAEIEALAVRRSVDEVSTLRSMEANSLGIRQLRNARVTESIASFDEAFRLNPGDPEIVNNFGYAYLRHDNADAAEPLLMLALVLDPGRANAWANLGQSLAMRGNTDVATAALMLAFQFSRDRGATYRFLESLGGDDDPGISAAARQTLQLDFLQTER